MLTMRTQPRPANTAAAMFHPATWFSPETLQPGEQDRREQARAGRDGQADDAPARAAHAGWVGLVSGGGKRRPV
jgi:hypothetical protein